MQPIVLLDSLRINPFMLNAGKVNQQKIRSELDALEVNLKY